MNIANHSTNLIYGRGLLTAEAIAQELRARLLNRMVHHYYALTPGQLLALARETLQQFEPLLARVMADTQLAAWVRGLEVVTAHTPRRLLQMIAAMKPPKQATQGLFVPPFIEQPTLPLDARQITFPALEEAADKLIAKNVVTKETWEAMSMQAQQDAFTVAGLASEDAIANVREVLEDHVRHGGTLPEFKQQAEAAIGSSHLGPNHLETVYRTNVQMAYADGQETMHQNPIIHGAFPYARYDAIHDGRVRADHLALETYGLNGTNIYRADDPMWHFFTPPFSFNCRCTKSFMTVKQAAKAGVREAQRWDRTGEPPENPNWRLDRIPFRPTDGFVGPGRMLAA